jgi:CBS-domain-containing membrane protein
MNSAVERLLRLRVADVMRRQIVTLSTDQTMATAANRLLEHEISGAPVVDEEHVCVGILSALDFVRREVRKDGSAVAAQSGRGSRSDRPAPAALTEGGDDDRVRSHMTRGVRSVDANASLIDAARLMCEAHVHRVPVLDRGAQVVGIISSLDIVAAMVGAIEE